MINNLVPARNLFLLGLFIFIGSSVFAQTASKSAPVKWETYNIKEKSISLLLPKMPVKIKQQNICTQQTVDKFAVYADGAVYGLNIVSKLNENIPSFCPAPQKFGDNSFKIRIDELKGLKGFSESKSVKIGDLPFEFIKTDVGNYWLFFDLKNKQWTELWTVNAEENSKTAADFVKSFRPGKMDFGIEIGEGSETTLGDPPADLKANLVVPEKDLTGTDSGSSKSPEIPLKVEKDSGGGTTSIRIVSKPSPRYTDAARKNNTQGSVLLRITFLSNGGIGDISPADELPYGLTEQAIIAAKKIVFIPAKRNGVNISMTKGVQYNFAIH